MVSSCFYLTGIGNLPIVFLFTLCLSNLRLLKCNINKEDKSTTNNLHLKTGEPPIDNGDTAIRCSCNLPKCVPFGYMCKSLEGVCFVYYNETKNDFNKYTSRHYVFPLQGCIEDLSQETKEQCRQLTPLHAEDFSSYDINKEGLTCCKSHVCNYQHAQLKEHSDYIKKRVDPVNTIRLSTEFFAGACVVAIPIIGGILFMLFLCLGRKMMLQERIYTPVQEIDDNLRKICHNGATFTPCGMVHTGGSYTYIFALNASERDYMAYKNAAISLSSCSFVSRSLPDLNMTPLPS